MHRLPAFARGANDNEQAGDVRLYIIQDVQRSELVKVGISSDPDRRLADLMSAYPAYLRVAFRSVPFTRARAREIEGISHGSLGNWALGHEWFDCGLSIARSVLIECGGHPERDVIGDVI